MKNESVGELVRKDYRAAGVFKSHKIDFCCGGNKSIEQVCVDKKIDQALLQTELSSAMTNTSESNAPNFDQWPLDLLADYIEKKHHRYVEASIPILKQYLKKLASVHGEGAPYLIEIAALFNESAGNLAQHMKKEELVLFPFIRKMTTAQLTHQPVAAPHFGSVSNPIKVMMDEHETEGDHFKQIEQLSNGYEIPDWACNTYAVTMNLLAEFQEDLHLHIHLENNILFPKALQMEASFQKSAV